MKIKDVSCITVDNFRTNWVFVVVTLEDGTVGLGESTLIGTETAVAAIVALWGERLVGESVLDVGMLHAKLQRESYWLTGPVMSAALSAIDVALWDAKARALGVPIYALLGGRVRREVPAYANGWYVGARTPGEFADKAQAIVDKGFRALKWDPFGAGYRRMARADINRAVTYVEAVRRKIGPDIDVMIEAHGRFDVATAIEVGRALEPFAISWLEEPVPPGRPHDLAEVRRATDVPIAAGERCYSRFDVANLLRAGAVDVIQPDVVHVGGLTEMVMIHGLVDSFSLPMAPHNPNGPVCHAASMHVAMAWEEASTLEIMVTDVPWRGAIFDEACTFADGCLRIDDRPGLGLTLNLDEARKYPYQPHQLRHFSGKLTQIRPPDAAHWCTLSSEGAADGVDGGPS